MRLTVADTTGAWGRIYMLMQKRAVVFVWHQISAIHEEAAAVPGLEGELRAAGGMGSQVALQVCHGWRDAGARGCRRGFLWAAGARKLQRFGRSAQTCNRLIYGCKPRRCYSRPLAISPGPPQPQQPLQPHPKPLDHHRSKNYNHCHHRRH